MGATKFVAQARERHICCRYGSLWSALLPATNIPPSAFTEIAEVRAAGARARLSEGAYPVSDLCDKPVAPCRVIGFELVRLYVRRVASLAWSVVVK